MQERLALLIDKAGITKTAFAQKLNITQPYVTKLLKTGSPSDRLIEDICEKFGVNEEWLRNGIEPMEKQPESFSLDDFDNPDEEDTDSSALMILPHSIMLRLLKKKSSKHILKLIQVSVKKF